MPVPVTMFRLLPRPPRLHRYRKKTTDEVGNNMHTAIQMHIEGMKEDGLRIPQSKAMAEYAAVG